MAFGEFLVIWLMIWGLVAVFVAMNASSKGRSGAFWFAAVLFLGIFGILAYVISVGVAGDDRVEQSDVDMSSSMESNEDLITQTSKSMADGIFCPKCGAGNPSDSNYCGECGNGLPDIDTWDNQP